LTAPWTDADELVATLQKRWAAGRYLLGYAAGTPWTPISLPVRAPTAAEVLEQLDQARRWADKFRKDSHSAAGAERFRVEHRVVRGRNVGANDVPARIWIDSFEQLCALLGTTRQVRALDEIRARTASKIPALEAWVVDHPQLAIEHHDIWESVLATVAWIAGNPTETLYLRQIDVDGVDTKFVERHQRLLDDLLASLLPPERIDTRFGVTDFPRRFRFRPKPDYVRLRLLSPQSGFPAGISELRLRSDELAGIELDAQTVFILENEITYLAFPTVPDAIVVFGSGYGLEVVKELPWLDRKTIVYWGDIDTHGFAILSNLRSRFAHVSSILMDHDTLLAHPRQWVEERTPTNRALPHLTAAEAGLYRDLIEDRFGHAVRLEQERVRFSLLDDVLRSWTGPL
jgi:hypothetical protein